MSILWTLCNLETCKNYDEHSRKDDMFHMKLEEMEDQLPTGKVDCAKNRLVQQIENLQYTLLSIQLTKMNKQSLVQPSKVCQSARDHQL